MLFCISADYTSQALVAMREKPTNRGEVMANLCEAAGGKCLHFWGTIGNGPGAMAVIDVDPSVAPTICGLIASSGSVQNVQMKRLFTMDEITGFRQKAKELSSAYRPAGQ
jgi:uncharacterized protein with GYD domain